MKKMIICRVLLFVGIIILQHFTGVGQAQQGVTILNYHHVGPFYAEGKQSNNFTVTQEVLRSHFDYLRQNGYKVISVDEYIQYNKGQKTLPSKSVMITFDDAYVSFYEKVFPLLKEYNYPSMLAMVGIWQEVPPPDPDKIINWNQAREMMKSGLVEIASHSYGLHYQVALNAYGDVAHAATTRQFSNGAFEAEETYKRRVRDDLRKSQELFEKELGRKGRAIVWPYGEYNEMLIDMAREEGFEVTFGLEGGLNLPGEQSLRAGKRGIIWGNPGLTTFAKFLADAGDEEKKVHAVQIDLDSLYDTDKLRFEANINVAIERVARTNANTVYLQAFSDEKGDGNISHVYFTNSIAPVKADIFSHVVTRFRNANVRVYAWVPTLTGQWLTKDNPEDLITAYEQKGKGWYRRATPFSPKVREKLRILLKEMAVYSPINGILFQDDLYMNDYEDFSPAARTAFRDKFGRQLTADVIKEPGIRVEWTKMKSEAMNDLTKELISTVREYRPNCPSARNIYAEAVINPKSFEWYAQDYQAYLKLYDFTVIMAYPYMEKKGDRAVLWLQELADAALKDKANTPKVLFKLQNYDWSKERWVPRAELSQQIRALRAKGAIHVGYYPENLFSDRHDSSPF